MARSIVLAFLLVIAILALAFVGFAWRSEIAPIEPPARSSFDAALIARGAQLAAVGDCVACHTAPHGRTYAGGFPLRTQFGTIYGTNITPDADTGIGRWSLQAFSRAMHEGVDRQGRHLYPAFPYDHFTRVGDEDIQALYAFFMTREPVRAETPANKLMFPLNVRMVVAGWKILFLDRDGFRAEQTQSSDWNRGAYLVQGLAHCGACHTPRNLLGAEKKRFAFSGGEAEGWHAPPLTADSRSPVPWSTESLFRYLRYGADDVHEAAVGPMSPVVHNLGSAPVSDVRAIATYMVSVMGPVDPQRQRRAEQLLANARSSELGDEAPPVEEKSGRRVKDADLEAGAAIYRGACMICHRSPQRSPGAASASALHLSLSTSISLGSPHNLIRIVLQGIAPPDGEAGPTMPGFSGALTTEQVAQLAAYLRTSYTDRPEWRSLEREVRKVQQSLLVKE